MLSLSTHRRRNHQHHAKTMEIASARRELPASQRTATSCASGTQPRGGLKPFSMKEPASSLFAAVGPSAPNTLPMPTTTSIASHLQTTPPTNAHPQEHPLRVRRWSGPRSRTGISHRVSSPPPTVGAKQLQRPTPTTPSRIASPHRCAVPMCRSLEAPERCAHTTHTFSLRRLLAPITVPTPPSRPTGDLGPAPWQICIPKHSIRNIQRPLVDGAPFLTTLARRNRVTSRIQDEVFKNTPNLLSTGRC